MDEDRVQLTQAELKAQRRRSVAIAIVLVALIAIFYLVTVFKLGT